MSLISGNVTFNSGSINYSANSNVIVGASSFCADAQNCGLISSGYFFDTAINAGTISSNAVFAGTSVNSGTASVAVFSGNAINCSSVTTCAIFVDTAVNAGSVANASFCASAVNNGIVNQCGSFYGSAVNCATVCGNAIFADTASNAASATVCGDADFAVTASNVGTVNGTTGVYTPPSSNWYDDSSSFSRNIVNGGSTQFDEGGGVKGAELNSSKSIDTNTSGAFAGDFTIEYFVKLDALYGFAIGNIRSGGGANDWGLGHPTDGSVYLSSTVQGHGQYAAGSLSVGHWSHIALVRNNGTLKLYTNGIERHTYTSSPAFDDSTDIVINPAIWASYHINGKMAMVRVSSVARYTDGTYTVPVSIFSSDADTLLLLNFGATTAPTVTAPNWYDDTSSAARTVTLNGTVTQSDEGSGVLAATFNGTNGFLTAQNSAGLDLTVSDFTIEGWANVANQAEHTFVAKANRANTSIGSYSVYVYNGVFRVTLGGADTDFANAQTIVTSYTPPAGGWFHFAVVRKYADTELLIFINGSLIQQTTITAVMRDNTDDLYIGKASADQDGYLNGKLAGLRIIKGTALYTSGFTVPTTPLTDVSGTELLLNFGATAVPTVTVSNWYDDTSSTPETVTLNGAVTQSDEGSGVIAADFGGGYLSTSLSDASGDFTLDLFVKPTENSTYRPIISLGSYTDGILLRNSSNGAADNLYLPGVIVLSGNNSYLNQSVWNHIALVRESNVFQIYVNGVSIASVSDSSTLDFSPAFIGSAVHNSNEVFSGKIAAIRLVVGSALYSGSTITIPTTLLTDVSGTELLLNFGATAVPTVNANPASGTVLSTETNTTVISEASQTVNNGTYDVIADGNGGSTNGNYQYTSSGTVIYDDNSTYHYVSDGNGGYTQYYRTGYLIQDNAVNNITINGIAYANGTLDEIADGSGSSTFEYTYASHGIELYDDGSTYHYVSDGVGGYTQYYRSGYLIQDNTVNNITINGASYPNGTFDEIADGSGSSTFQYTYASHGIELHAANGISYQSDGNGGYFEVNNNPAVGTVLSTETNTTVITEASQTVNNGTYDVIADGSGGSSNGNYQYTSSGTELYDDASTYHYVSDGNGGYTQYYRSGYLIQDNAVNNITINGTAYANGTYDEIADGSGGSTNGDYQYAIVGTEFYATSSVSYQSDGNGGYTEVTIHPVVGTVLSTEINTVTITEASQTVNNGTYDVIADGSGGSTNGNYQYTSSGTELYDDASTYHYVSDGNGGYTQYYRSGYVITAAEINTVTITEASQTVNNGTYDVIADGSGGSSNGNYQYASSGTELYDDALTYHYVSDGVGGYTQYYRSGYLIQDNTANTISINSGTYPNGTFDEIANGSGGSTFTYEYLAVGSEFYNDEVTSYQSDGNGGYTEVAM